MASTSSSRGRNPSPNSSHFGALPPPYFIPLNHNWANGSVGCAAHSTTSTTTSTIIHQTINFSDTFVYDHDHQQQRLPMYSNSLYFKIQSQVRKIDASHYIQRWRVIKILQLLTFGPDVEPEPPPTIPLVVSGHSKCL